MSFLLRFLTWWNSQTLNTQFWTWRHGVRVGEDGAGNVFYQTKDGKRRWVIYGAEAEASQITPEWHGWLHHTWAEPPTELAVPRKAWEQPHKSNQTGTPGAYVPAGSLYRAQPAPRSDYDAWRPE
ncbi:NADH:ubiquinone oxidoreductase subunit NDUFA12 [Paracoccus gahaiensis]|uniref:NADH:ubiquinone oxidoreductase subunit NDUFA12 n=1 Tax=Paracoccus gahaiensis TaxID=1706839 RepID=A0A4U0RG36_9RHOB|nr:NADH:ubiquinone oxidoreductase subunit NDUFA12 [Paracoccus gahaiensis]TJZ94157.1 NADH:ubiquinone oxidoreductase subunit NDUFA12 [Paracoccus gahaiensis]